MPLNDTTQLRGLRSNDTHRRRLHLRGPARQLEAWARSRIESLVALIRFLRAYISAQLTPVLGDERGEIASWVVVTALVVVAAVTIVGIVVSKLTTSANNIQTP